MTQLPGKPTAFQLGGVVRTGGLLALELLLYLVFRLTRSNALLVPLVALAVLVLVRIVLTAGYVRYPAHPSVRFVVRTCDAIGTAGLCLAGGIVGALIAIPLGLFGRILVRRLAAGIGRGLRSTRVDSTGA